MEKTVYILEKTIINPCGVNCVSFVETEFTSLDDAMHEYNQVNSDCGVFSRTYVPDEEGFYQIDHDYIVKK